jgi:cephalosporin-C deacetylase-like acetyl esterase
MSKEVRADYQSKVNKPADFKAFWQGVLRQVEAIPLAPEVIAEPLRTSEDIEVFQVFYNSLDQVRIAA